jgi:hypothetical protein
METLEVIRVGRREYERLMKTFKKLGLNPSTKYKITEKGKDYLNDIKAVLNSYDRSLFGRRKTKTVRKEEIRAMVLDILEKVAVNLLDLKFYLNKSGQRLYYRYVAEMVNEGLIAPVNEFYF